MNPSESRGHDLIPIDVSHLDRLVAALGLVDANPGRQIRRDARGWKESELQLARILIGAIRPSVHAAIMLATGLVNGSCRGAVLLGEDLVGPVGPDEGFLDAVISAWPAPGAWASEGWITVDGPQFDLMLSTLGASTRLRYTMANEMDLLSASIGALLHAIGEQTDSAALREWLSATKLFGIER